MIKSLFLKGINITANQLVTPSIAQKLGEEFGIKVTLKERNPETSKNIEKDDSRVTLPRPPIVTVMGHVDHGKTTLLDKIRKTQYAQKEIGGITQKIGAHEVIVKQNDEERKIIFLDTPGHEAFSKMRSRGVSIADIAILVVAADDGLRPQTIEAIQQIQSAKIPLIIAINKIDKDNANIETIKKDLTKYNIISEEWGGDSLIVPISALQGTNIDKLLETVLILGEVLELRANPNGLTKGMVLESHLDKTKGSVASLIVKEGTLRLGDTILIDETISKIRGMMNSTGEIIKDAKPSSAVVVWGLPKVPSIGTQFFSFKDEKEAKLFNDNTTQGPRSSVNSPLVLQTLEENAQDKKQLNLIIKADSQGSLEAVTSNILTQYTPSIQIRILQASIGEITGTDLEFAYASKSNILAFNTTYATGIKKLSKNTNVNIREFEIIYDLFDYVQFLIDEKIGPQYEEKLTGTCVVKTVFPLAKSFVAGTSVTKGKILKTSFIHVIRDMNILYKGYITSLKKVKEDALEVSEGSDCGIFVTEFGAWKPNDIIEAFDLIEKKSGTL
jgi:translation initiation factor IF-2